MTNKHQKNFWGPTPSDGGGNSHAHFFTDFFTSEILKFGVLGMKEPFYVSGSGLVEYKWAKRESFFQTPKSVRCTEMLGMCARSAHAIATSKIPKFGLLSTKESFYMPRSDLLEYKWAKMESFFQTPKSVQCTEVPSSHRVTCAVRRAVRHAVLHY